MPVRTRLTVALSAALAAASLALGPGCGSDPGAADGSIADAAADGGPPIDAAADAAPTSDARPGASCADPLALELGVPLAGDSTGYPEGASATCSPLAGDAPGVVHRVELGDTPVDLLVEVAVDEGAAPPFDAVLVVRSACSLDGPCADGGWGERLEALAVSGPRFVVVGGTTEHDGAASGSFTLGTTTRAIVAARASCDPAGLASRCADGLRCVAGACVVDGPEVACAAALDLTADLADGEAAVDDALRAFEPDLAQATCAFDPAASVAERMYRFELDAPADLVATTAAPATDFDTVLSLRAGGCDGAELACHDDLDPEAHVFTSRLELAALPAGVYTLVVDGSSALPRRGGFHLAVSLTPVD